MSTPKEKAEEMFDKMYAVEDNWGDYPMGSETAKQCALIAVEEILKAVTTIADKKYDYWQEVKEAINNLK